MDFLRRALIIFGVMLIVFGIFGSAGAIFPIIGVVMLGFGIKLEIDKKKKKDEKTAEDAKPRQSTEHGSANWASSDEIGQIFPKEESGLYIGGGIVRRKSGHLLSVASSGAGKGTCLIIPSLLVDPYGSYIVTDPKGENAFITARWQKEAGQKVYILDPWGEQEKMGATHGIPSSGFNPFSYIKKNMEELRDNCESVAIFLIPENPSVKDPYWNDRARSLIKILLMHIITALPEEDHNFWTLYKMLRYSWENMKNLMFDLKKNDAEDGLIAIAAEEIIGIMGSENTFAGIISSAQNATTIFESPQLRKSLSADDFNPYSLTDGDCTVYVVIPERYINSHSVWLRLVIGLSLKACNAKPNKRVNFLMDEMAVLGKMPDIQRGFAFARGQNIVLWAFVQNLSQLKQIYGEDGMNSFISSSNILQFFGTKDNFTTEYVSKMLGDTTRRKENVTWSDSGQSYSTSTNYEKYGRRLLTADEVEKNTGIITIAEGLRIQLDKKPYFVSSFDKYELDDAHHKMKADWKAQGKRMEWYDDFMVRADPRPRDFD